MALKDGQPEDWDDGHRSGSYARAPVRFLPAPIKGDEEEIMNRFYATLEQSKQLREQGKITIAKPLREQPIVASDADVEILPSGVVIILDAVEYYQIPLRHPSGEYRMWEPTPKGRYVKEYHVGVRARFDYEYKPVPQPTDITLNVVTSVEKRDGVWVEINEVEVV